jgi:Mg/Co/Ni transporter MgtE
LLSLGLAGVRAWMMGIGMEITLIVSLTLVCITLWSAIVSSVIPMVLSAAASILPWCPPRLSPRLSTAPG